MQISRPTKMLPKTMVLPEQRLLPKNWIEHDLSSISNLAPIQRVEWKPLNRQGISLSIKREDLLDARLGGNKLYKLYGHLKSYQSRFGHNINSVHYSDPDDAFIPPHIASFGGAYSNHLYALASACDELSIPCLAIVRGERPEYLSPTLADVEAMGMSLCFVSRERYRRKNDPELAKEVESQFGICHWLPEGGGGLLGTLGCEDLGYQLASMKSDGTKTPDVICTACGTGSTLAGIIAGVSKAEKVTGQSTSVLGISVLKGEDRLSADIQQLLRELGCQKEEWSVNCDYHCGGYAKFPEYLGEFVCQFEDETGIPLDPVYTAKLVWAVTQMAQQGYWPSGTHIMLLHSGGLQGRRGFAQLCAPVMSN